MCFFLIFRPLTGDFADAGDGDWEGGGGPFGNVLESFMIILGPPYANKLCFSTQNKFL